VQVSATDEAERAHNLRLVGMLSAARIRRAHGLDGIEVGDLSDLDDLG
jgi:hypothetical protein